MSQTNGTTVLWFRHGLRLHDNPALLEAIQVYHRPNFYLYSFLMANQQVCLELCLYLFEQKCIRTFF